MNEFEAHESSYDHQHKKRLKEMKEMQRSVVPKKEEKGGPLISMKLGSKKEKDTKTMSSGGGWKKVGGFKNAFEDKDDQEDTRNEQEKPEADDSDVTDDEDYYDPRFPTGCTSQCPSGVKTAAS